MAITVNIYYYGVDDNARNFAIAMSQSGIVSEIRNFPGNLKYEYFLPLDKPNEVLLIDQWVDQAALDHYHHSDLMPKILALRTQYDLKMRVERYMVDPNSVTELDKQFIVK